MEGTSRLSALPNWPARLSEDFAALYLGVGKTTFRDRWQSRVYPQPIREGKRLLWNRRQLDRFVDAQFGLAQGDGKGDETWDDFS